MANPKLSSLTEAFTAPALNVSLWNTISGGTPVLDTVNDLVSLPMPTTSGAILTFGESALFDATGCAMYAQVGVAANGNGGTKSIMRVRLDANNAMTMRVESGIFRQSLISGGTTTNLALPTYDPHAHRWWQLRESGGVFFADASPDGLNWTNLGQMAYTWDATAITLRFESQASVTEVAGNATTVQNINCRIGGTDNPNWPDVRDEWGAAWAANGGDSPLDRYVDVSLRTRGSTTVSRGRQYELDQVRSGTYTVALANTDAALDPTNASGPYAGHVLPYQPYRKRAQWPATRNMLTQVQATGGDLGVQPLGPINAGNSGPSIFTDTDPSLGSFVASATAWQGSTVMQFAVPGTATAGQRVCFTPQPGVAPGRTYTVQMRVRNITPSTTVQVAAQQHYLTAANVTASLALSSTVTLTGSATAPWTLVSVTATAAATAALIFQGLRLIAPPSATCSVQVDGWQMEEAATASAWACPGAWYPIIAGFVEDWPSQWDMGGTYGTVSPTPVDAFALLSQRTLDDPLTAEINSHNPRFLFTLNDPQGSASASDATGSYLPAPLTVSKYGAGSLTFGNAITATDTTNGVFTGGSDAVATVNNASPGTNLYAAATYISLAKAGIGWPGGLWAASFTRMVAFRYTGPVPTSGYATVWSASPRSKSSLSLLGVVIAPDQKPYVFVNGPGGAGFSLNPPGGTVCDGNWHLITYSFNAATLGVSVGMDGVSGGTATLTAAMLPTDMNAEALGAWIEADLGNAASWNYKGDIAYAAEFPAVLSGSDLTQIYKAWKNSCTGDSTNARYSRILRYAGYIGPSSVQTGLTTSMGAAAFGGQDAVTALQAVVETEGGEHFVDASGAVTFRSRAARYDAFTPTVIFGERTDLGEIPYEDCQTSYDSTHLGNIVTVTQDGTGQVFKAPDQASITAYFPRPMSRTINSSSALECQDAASYLLSRYKQPATRVSTLKMHPSANPAIWPVCLGLELGTRVRVMRRPPGVPATTIECFAENIAWSFDDTGEATLTLQCSPADLTPYAVFAAWHTVTSQAYPIGTSGIAVKPNEDNTNPLASQIAPGQQIILEPGTANAETLTVSTVGATSPGWTFGVLVMTSATTKAHPALAVISEALPAGTTDPTLYDASAVFDAVTFAY